GGDRRGAPSRRYGPRARHPPAGGKPLPYTDSDTPRSPHAAHQHLAAAPAGGWARLRPPRAVAARRSLRGDAGAPPQTLGAAAPGLLLRRVGGGRLSLRATRDPRASPRAATHDKWRAW